MFNSMIVRNWGFSLLIIIVFMVATVGVEAVFVVVVDSELVFTPTLWAVVVS